MIERQHDEITLMCDDCDGDLDRTFDAATGFSDMIAYAKSVGWKIAKDPLEDDGWVHTCPSCTAERAPQERQLGLF
jgi:hypothetical protein